MSSTQTLLIKMWARAQGLTGRQLKIIGYCQSVAVSRLIVSYPLMAYDGIELPLWEGAKDAAQLLL